jgi:hypothetical protein
VAEQFALEELLGQGGGIDRDKGPGSPRAFGVDDLGEVFLADPGLAGDQEQGIAGGYLPDLVHEDPHYLAVGDEIGELRFGKAPVVETLELEEQAAGLQGRLDGVGQAFQRDAGVEHGIGAGGDQLGLFFRGFDIVEDDGGGVLREVVECRDSGFHRLGDEEVADDDDIAAALHHLLPGVFFMAERFDLDVGHRDLLFEQFLQSHILQGENQSGEHGLLKKTVSEFFLLRPKRRCGKKRNDAADKIIE